MRGAETADGVWREVAGFRGPGLSEASRPFHAFTKKHKKRRQAVRRGRRLERDGKREKKERRGGGGR